MALRWRFLDCRAPGPAMMVARPWGEDVQSSEKNTDLWRDNYHTCRTDLMTVLGSDRECGDSRNLTVTWPAAQPRNAGAASIRLTS